ncbi:MAG: FIST C-terminal domain-containing protein [Rhodospirillales bacterium]|nr:FIST C-terminal domain-containing protein [Rhodospirillales bacterium]
MSLYTSEKFASASAAGTDWRDTARAVLEQLESLPADKDHYNLGILYISDHLAEDAGSIVTLFRSVTGIEHWVGSVGMGLCATGQDYVDTPALSVMVGRFDPDQFHLFSSVTMQTEDVRDSLTKWKRTHTPMLVLTHGTPDAENDPEQLLSTLEQETYGFVTGGFASSHNQHLHFSDELFTEGLSGVIFSQDIPVASTIAQGCVPIGPEHTVTRGREGIIETLDDRPPFEVFAEDLRLYAASRAESGQAISESDLQDLFQGQVHIAFPVPGSDQQDYMVRNINGIDPDSGLIAVAKDVRSSQRLVFVHQNIETQRAGLSRTLLALRKRITDENGIFNPQGALYISCAARCSGKQSTGDMEVIKEIIGEIPLTGFYANGEISNHHLYGYTGILILFL